MMSLLLLFAVLVSACHSFCPVDLDVKDRIDCHPWPGVNEETCNALEGCEWCENEPGTPWCIKNPEQCPSLVPTADRINCQAGSREECTDNDCVWCPVADEGVPWCFLDSEVTTGGQTCPTEEFFVSDEERVDCGPEAGVTDNDCVQRGCYWCETEVLGAPWCFAPKTLGYLMDGDPVETEKGWRIQLTRRHYPTWFGADIINLTVDVEFQTDDRLRVKIYDPNNARHEVPLDIPSPSGRAPNRKYEIVFSNNPAFNFKVVRISSGLVLFDTSIGGLQFADQFLSIGAYLPTGNVYGFGETEHHTFRHDMNNYNTWPMYARDFPTGLNNGYGVHPYFQGLDDNNEMFGVLLLNSNAQEVDLIPAPGVVYRTVGGIFDFYFFLGPEPEEVTQQYTEAIGRPIMPPYWALGFHLSRFGYQYLDVMNDTIQRNRDAGVPVDVIHGDIDYMHDYIIFTYSEDRYNGLPQYVKDLKENQGIHFITILDPFLPNGEDWYEPYIRGNEQGVFVKNADRSDNSVGRAWPPGDVVFADYTNPATHQWWEDECVLFHDTIEYDGIWIDMNEPSNFVTGSIHGCDYNKINNPLYKPRSILGDVIHEHTVCSAHSQHAGNHYDYHSLYGWSMSPASIDAARAATGKRSFVFSRSTYPGSGKHVGHWLGDNWSLWERMGYSIIGMLEFNYFGIPYVGADICGFFENAEQQMCERWQQLGAFYGFSRNHNGNGWIEQDPAFWEGGSVAETSKFTLEIRYTLLPYLYTLYHKAHGYGSTVIRPLVNEFPADTECQHIDKQFLWGSGFLISPVLTVDTFSITAYFPDQRWYSYHDGAEVGVRGAYTTLDAPWDFINLHVRGGSILPTQQPALATVYSRLNPMGLIVALDDNNKSFGELYWDDGESLSIFVKGEYFHAEYDYDNGILFSTNVVTGYDVQLTFDHFRVLGITTEVSSVSVNGNFIDTFTVDPSSGELLIHDLGLAVDEEFLVVID